MTDDRHQPNRQKTIALKVDIELGLTDMAAGRVREFDVHRIVERRKKLSAKWRLFDQTVAEVRSKSADVPPDEMEALIADAVTAARLK